MAGGCNDADGKASGADEGDGVHGGDGENEWKWC